MTEDQRTAIIQRVFNAHRFVRGKTVDPRIIRAIAADLRTEFDQVGARWDEIAQFAASFLADWRAHPKLTREQSARGVNAFLDGYRLVGVEGQAS